MVDRGQGIPLVLIPGVQGRWEWMRPTVEALAARCRVVTFSLGGDEALGFDGFTVQLDAIFEQVGLEQACLCGVSYGGLIALRYAATRPRRVSHLVLASTPSPSWRPNKWHARYIRSPRLFAPMFAAGVPWRLGPEIRAAFPSWRARVSFTAAQFGRVVTAMPSPNEMGLRMRLISSVDLRSESRRVGVPTLVLTGEPGLDHVVDPDNTREYLNLIRGSQGVTLERTGHIGLVTRPQRFADVVLDFVGREHVRVPQGTGASGGRSQRTATAVIDG